MTLVCVWLRSLAYDVEEILASIDVEGNQKLAESLLTQLFTVIDEAQNDPSLGTAGAVSAVGASLVHNR